MESISDLNYNTFDDYIQSDNYLHLEKLFHFENMKDWVILYSLKSFE